jgi:hypothetical protein
MSPGDRIIGFAGLAIVRPALAGALAAAGALSLAARFGTPTVVYRSQANARLNSPSG